MKIKRLQLDVELEATSFHVFHTGMPDRSGEPPTIITVNGKEFEGDVSFIQDGDNYKIEIKKRSA